MSVREDKIKQLEEERLQLASEIQQISLRKISLEKKLVSIYEEINDLKY